MKIITLQQLRIERLENIAAFLAAYSAEIGESPSVKQVRLLQLFIKAGDSLPINAGKTWFYSAWRKVDIIPCGLNAGREEFEVWNLIEHDEATHRIVVQLVEGE